MPDLDLTQPMVIGYALGFAGAMLMVGSFLMKSMLPLRLTALAASCFFFAYGWVTWALPSLLLYGLLIPINIRKAVHVWQLVKAVERARGDEPVAEWLVPHMRRKTARAGTTLWRKGDKAASMVYVESGTLRLTEIDRAMGPGSLLGEIGLFAPDGRRTMTVVCDTDCVLHTMSAADVAQLYYTNPKLGFHVMRLVTQRLLADIERRENALHAAAARVERVPEPTAAEVATSPAAAEVVTAPAAAEVATGPAAAEGVPGPSAAAAPLVP